jgi:hypothetical protein
MTRNGEYETANSDYLLVCGWARKINNIFMMHFLLKGTEKTTPMRYGKCLFVHKTTDPCLYFVHRVSVYTASVNTIGMSMLVAEQPIDVHLFYFAEIDSFNMKIICMLREAG